MAERTQFPKPNRRRKFVFGLSVRSINLGEAPGFVSRTNPLRKSKPAEFARWSKPGG